MHIVVIIIVILIIGFLGFKFCQNNQIYLWNNKANLVLTFGAYLIPTLIFLILFLLNYFTILQVSFFLALYLTILLALVLNIAMFFNSYEINKDFTSFLVAFVVREIISISSFVILALAIIYYLLRTSSEEEDYE